MRDAIAILLVLALHGLEAVAIQEPALVAPDFGEYPCRLMRDVMAVEDRSQPSESLMVFVWRVSRQSNMRIWCGTADGAMDEF